MTVSTQSKPASNADSDLATGAAGTILARLVLSAISLVSLLLGVLALAAGLDALRTIGLLTFCVLGIGAAPWQLNASIRLATRVTLAGFTSLAVLTVVATAMVTLQSWHPALCFVVVATLGVVLHGVGLRWALLDLRAVHPELRHAGAGRLLAEWSPHIPSAATVRRLLPALSAVSGGGLCVVAALTHRHIDPGFGGFPTQIGPAWVVGLVLVVAGLVFARGEGERGIAVTVLVLLVVLTLTPALVYDGPRSQSAEKHVDLVQQIRELHKLNSSVAIYNAWGGFFAAVAWLCDVSGIRDPMRLATFWPPLIGLLRLVSLRYLAGQVLRSPYQRWVAVALAILADPLGADYFSPQSVGFLLGIVMFGLALSHCRTGTRVALLLLGGCVLAVTHQFSPYVVGGALLLLVLFRQVRPWWTPALVLVPAIAWAVLHRDSLRGFLSLADIGRVQNFRAPTTVGSAGLQRLPIVEETVVALVVGLLLLGALAAVAVLRHARQLSYWALAACPAVGILLVATNPYGQEGIFRAALFAIPWLALLAARCFSPPTCRPPRLPLAAVYGVLTVTFLVASFGLDATNVVRQSDVAAFSYFDHQKPFPAGATSYLLALGGGDLPGTIPTVGATHQVISRDDLSAGSALQLQDPPTERTVATLTSRFVAYSEQPPSQANLLAIWSPVSSAYDWAYGVQTPQAFAALRDAFAASPYWQIAFTQDGTVIFRFNGARYGSATG